MGAAPSSPIPAPSSPIPAAKAALLHAHAAAETTRAAADAAATTARAAAETKRAAADAAATTARADARVAAAAAMTAAKAGEAAAAAAVAAAAAAMRRAVLAASGVIVVALVVDFALCEWPALIRYRMMRTLRACHLPPSVPVTSAPLLPVPQAPLCLGPRPTMLLGPTGSGKSTVLAELARAAVSAPTPAPVVLMRLRVSSRKHRGAEPTAQSGADLMAAVVALFCTQIGYPLRPSIIGGIFARGFTFQGKYSKAELAAPDSAPRLIRALRLLFSVCADLRNERAAAGMSALDAAPVLLFDEVQDLIKDDRLRAIGGEDVFDALAALIVAHSVDRLDVRAMVAGSSAELYFAFTETVARGNRWRYRQLADPAPDVVVAALVKRKYTEADARAMVALCGTRLRLLAEPLVLGAATLDAATFLSESAEVGRTAFTDVFKMLGTQHKEELARILDDIAACDARGAPDSDSLRDFATRPTKESLSDSVLALEIALILYVDRESGLFFQSTLHANTWARVRLKYVGATRLLASST
jgi:hypothetical protein